MNPLPKITIKTPESVTITTGSLTFGGQMYYNLFVKGPEHQYHDLFASVDNGPQKLIARWSDPFQPHRYVIYQRECLKAKQLDVEIKLWPVGVYPSGSLK